MVARLERDAGWAIFLRWCEATGRDPAAVDEDDAEVFFTQVPAAASTRRRRAAVLRARVGVPSPTGAAAARGLAGVDELPQAQAHTVRGCRDRAIVATLEVGLSRRRVASLQPDAVHVGEGLTVEHHVVPVAADARLCRACAVVSWLQVLALGAIGSRRSAREQARHLRLASDRGEHVCSAPLEDGWRVAPAVFPQLDRHGWFGAAPLTPRSVYRVLQFLPTAPPLAAATPGSDEARRQPVADRETVFTELLDAESDVDELGMRIDALMIAMLDVSREVGQYGGSSARP